MDQLQLDTATWGLKYWEETLGIAVEEEKAPEFRRSRIRSKLRGAGVTTSGHDPERGGELLQRRSGGDGVPEPIPH